MRRGLGALLTAVTLLTGCTSSESAEREGAVRVAAAASLQPVLDALDERLAAAEPPLDLRITYGASGLLVRQIQQGAPFDVFLSADVEYPQELVRAHLAEPDDAFVYAAGRLALWAPENSPVDPAQGLPGLADTSGRVALANPRHAPYGAAARQALDTAGVDLGDRVVFGENVAQALDMARSGAADAAVVALSLVTSPALDGVGRWQEVAPESFPEIEHGGVLLSQAGSRDAAERLRDALRDELGARLLRQYGLAPKG